MNSPEGAEKSLKKWQNYNVTKKQTDHNISNPQQTQQINP